MSGPITIGAPPIGGGNYDHEIRQLSQQLQALQRVMDGMSLQTIVDAEGTAYDIIGRYMGPRDIGSERLPFEIYTRGQDLVAAPGTIHTTSIPEQVVGNPASGNWYFEVRVAIDGLNGSITTAVGEWVQTPSSIYSNTEKSLTLGNITVVAGVPDLPSLQQYNFGPILVAIYGGVTEKWNIEIY